MARQGGAVGPSTAGGDPLGLAVFRRYYRTVRENVWLLVATVVVCMAAAAGYVVKAPRRYSSTAQMLVSPAPASDTTLFSLPVIHSSTDPTRDSLTAASLITTNQVADAVRSQLRMSTPASTVLQNVQVAPVGQSNLLAVQATAGSAAGAQRLANAVADQAVSVRTQALHRAIAAVLPGLRAQVAGLPVGQRSVPGTVGDQYNQLLQLQQANDPTLAVVSPAQLPDAPFSPNTKLSLAAGLLGGLILGIAAAFGWSALDPRLKREEQLREIFRAPILSRIPPLRRRQGSRPINPEDVPDSVFEGYRTLRTMITARAAGEPQAYLVTGSMPSEGKTTSAMCLAVALAQGGAGVILIEADLRRPTMNEALGLRPDHGTDQVLIGEVPLSRALLPIRVNNVPLKVLTSNRSGVHLADRLSFARAQRLIDEAKREADFVVIDSPPLTTVIDALPLAQHADEILIVARLGHSRVRKLIELEQLFAANGTSASGIVLLGVEQSQSDYSYYVANGDQGGQATSDARRARRASREGTTRSS